MRVASCEVHEEPWRTSGRQSISLRDQSACNSISQQTRGSEVKKLIVARGMRDLFGRLFLWRVHGKITSNGGYCSSLSGQQIVVARIHPL
jgi:hypothetical protein